MGSSLGRVKAHDLDAGANAKVEYGILPGDGSSVFDVYTDAGTQEGIVVLKKVNKQTRTNKNIFKMKDILIF